MKARTSRALTEVRTVHSRAKTALDRRAGHQHVDGDWYSHSVYDDDPDGEEMRTALTQVVALLDRWAR